MPQGAERSIDRAAIPSYPLAGRPERGPGRRDLPQRVVTVCAIPLVATSRALEPRRTCPSVRRRLPRSPRATRDGDLAVEAFLLDGHAVHLRRGAIAARHERLSH
jgi:hypothetical protein